MPFKSKAQQRFFFAAEANGELPKGTALEWAHATKNIKKLPERAKRKEANMSEKTAFDPKDLLNFVPGLGGFIGGAREPVQGLTRGESAGTSGLLGAAGGVLGYGAGRQLGGKGPAGKLLAWLGSAAGTGAGGAGGRTAMKPVGAGIMSRLNTAQSGRQADYMKQLQALQDSFSAGDKQLATEIGSRTHKTAAEFDISRFLPQPTIGQDLGSALLAGGALGGVGSGLGGVAGAVEGLDDEDTANHAARGTGMGAMIGGGAGVGGSLAAAAARRFGVSNKQQSLAALLGLLGGGAAGAHLANHAMSKAGESMNPSVGSPAGSDTGEHPIGLKRLGPTDKPVQTIKFDPRSSEADFGKTAHVRGFCTVTLLTLVKQAHEAKQPQLTNRLVKLARAFRDTHNLPQALQVAYPEKTVEERQKMAALIVSEMRRLQPIWNKTGGWGQQLGEMVDNGVASGWNSLKGWANKNIAEPSTGVMQRAQTWTNNNITNPIRNAGEAVARPFRVAGAVGSGLMQTGRNMFDAGRQGVANTMLSAGSAAAKPAGFGKQSAKAKLTVFGKKRKKKAGAGTSAARVLSGSIGEPQNLSGQDVASTVGGDVGMLAGAFGGMELGKGRADQLISGKDFGRNMHKSMRMIGTPGQKLRGWGKNLRTLSGPLLATVLPGLLGGYLGRRAGQGVGADVFNGASAAADGVSSLAGKMAASQTISMPSPASPAATTTPRPESPAAKRQVRYSFNRAPAKK